MTKRLRSAQPRGFVLLAVLVALAALTAGMAVRVYPALASSRGIQSEAFRAREPERALLRRALDECARHASRVLEGPSASRGLVGVLEGTPTFWHLEGRWPLRCRTEVVYKGATRSLPDGDSRQMLVQVEAVLGDAEAPSVRSRAEVAIRVREDADGSASTRILSVLPLVP